MTFSDNTMTLKRTDNTMIISCHDHWKGQTTQWPSWSLCCLSFSNDHWKGQTTQWPLWKGLSFSQTTQWSFRKGCQTTDGHWLSWSLCCQTTQWSLKRTDNTMIIEKDRQHNVLLKRTLCCQWPFLKRTDNTMTIRKGQTTQWPSEKDRQHNDHCEKDRQHNDHWKGQTTQWSLKRTDNTMIIRKGQTTQWPLEKDRQHNDH